MPQKSYSEFRQQALMSQRLADSKPDYVDLAGSDPKTSLKIQRLKVMQRHGFVEEDELSFILALLNGDRMAFFATSERVNEITKLGLQMPKASREVDYDAET